jgi:TolA-binding protein
MTHPAEIVMRIRFRAWLAFTLIATVAFAEPATTRPAQAPTDLNGLVQQAQSELFAELYKDAQTHFARAMSIDPKNVTAVHGAALSALGLKQNVQAKALMEKARGLVTKSNRAVAYNLAVTYLLNDQPRDAAVSLKQYLDETRKTVDARMFDLSLAALLAAELNGDEDMESLEAFVADYGQRVDALRPGFKRWGIEWRRPDETDKHRAQLRDCLTELTKLRKEIKVQQSVVQAREKDIEDVQDRGRHAHAMSNRADHLKTARARLAQLKDQAVETQKKFAAAFPPLDQVVEPIAMNDLSPPDVTKDDVTPTAPPPNKRK